MSAFRVQIFVDGGHLRTVVEAFQGENSFLDLVTLENALLLPDSILPQNCFEPETYIRTRGGRDVLAPRKLKSLIKTTYYDAEDEKIGDETRAYWQLISQAPDTNLYLGDLKKKRRQGREQKKVDVKITVDILAASLRNEIDAAVLVSADSDFVPLLEELRRTSTVSIVIGDPKPAASLFEAADRCMNLDALLRGAYVSPDIKFYDGLSISNRAKSISEKREAAKSK